MDSDESHPTTIEVIMKRKSVRKYTDEKVSEETLEKIVRAGMAAPTAANKQPWSFIIITDRETLDKLAEKMPYSKMLFKAPAAIVVCGVPKWGLPDRENDFWIQDCSAASENILLAVESLGLGAVWTGAYPIEQRVKDVRNILGIPKDVVPLNVIAIGHPTGVEKPKDKWKPERVHRNKW
ncbi:MAG: nitroreductase family protein [Candidatus Eremiobacteraeota bacterium]|nr:nitroreductase family protein [Candidatus Eremiobacteraeota bacterium]